MLANSKTNLGLEIKLLSKYLDHDMEPNCQGECPMKCPFHKGGNEHTASFSFNVLKGVGYCHTCDEGWSTFTLLQKLGAPKAVLDSLPDQRYNGPILEDAPPFGVDMFDPTILSLYKYCPTMLVDAGFDEKVLKDYDVGYDQYTKQITFPVRDHLGALVAIMGRTTTGRTAKYLPYGEDILGKGYTYRKKYYIWGAHKVYPIAMSGKLDKIVVTEGFKAALWCIQEGYKTVAMMGLRVSGPQLDLLEMMGADIVLFPDQDKYGYIAIEKICDNIRNRKIRISVVEYEGRQPDDVPRDKVSDVIDSAIPYSGWLLKQRRRR